MSIIRLIQGNVIIRILIVFVLLGHVSCNTNTPAADLPEAPGQIVSIASFNIRYNNTDDEGNLWKTRKNLVAKILKTYQFDVFGAQEPHYDQLLDMIKLSPDYAYLGRSRTGEETSGEFAPIFYNKERIDVLETGQFWLTEKDRDKPNIGWDAALPRICTWAKVKHGAANTTFFVFNIHFDHRGAKAREESSKLMLQLMPKMAAGYPYFLLGDFNFDQTSENYQLLKNSSVLADSYDGAQERVNGNRGTYNGWNPNSSATARIDHIFVSKPQGPTITNYQVITDSFEGKLPSDHFPVMIEVSF